MFQPLIYNLNVTKKRAHKKQTNKQAQEKVRARAQAQARTHDVRLVTSKNRLCAYALKIKRFVAEKESFLSYTTLAAFVIVAAKLLAYQIDRPWIGLHDFNGGFWSNVARNWMRYGILDTKLAQIINYGPLRPEQYEIYIHHPPLLPLLLVVAFKLFGESEVVARCVPLLFSLGSIVFVFLIAKHFWGLLGAVFAAVSFIAAPHFLYFGKMVDHEALTLFFMLGATYFYVLWREAPSGKNISLMILMFVGGGLSDWPAYYFMAAIFILDIILEKRIRAPMLLIPATACILLLLFLLNISILKGASNALSDMVDIFMIRSGQKMGPKVDAFTWPSLGERTYFRLQNEFTWFFVMLSFIGLGIMAYIRNSKAKLYMGIALAWYATAIFHIVMFPNGAWKHNYWFFYLLVPLAVPAAVFTAFVFKKRILNIAILVLGVILITGLIYMSSQTTKYAYQAEIDPNPNIFGKTINQNSDFNTLVFTDLIYMGPKASYYADRFILWSTYTPEKLQSAMKIYKQDKAVFVAAAVSPEMSGYLDSKYRYKDLKEQQLRLYYLTPGK